MENTNGTTIEPMEKNPVAGENITLKVASIIGFLSVFALCVWWAACLQGDVRTMQSDLSGIKQSIQNLSKIETVQTDIRELKQFGSDVSRKLALDFIDLKRDFELYKVQHSMSK